MCRRRRPLCSNHRSNRRERYELVVWVWALKTLQQLGVQLPALQQLTQQALEEEIQSVA